MITLGKSLRDYTASKKLHFRYGGGGALVCDEPIEGITQDLKSSDDLPCGAIEFYGGRYFVAETLTKEAARKIAQLLGGVLDE